MEDIYTGHMNVTVAGAVLVRDYEGSHSPVWQRLRLRCGLMTLWKEGCGNTGDPGGEEAC